jgi:hypothetical protein
VYLGPQSKAQRYFESHLAVEVHAHENPADVIMDSIAQSGDAYARAWVASGREYLEAMPAIAIIPAVIKAYSLHDEKKNLHGHQSSVISGARGSGVPAARYEAAGTAGITTQAWAAKGGGGDVSESDVLESPPHSVGHTNAPAHPFAVPPVGATIATSTPATGGGVATIGPISAGSNGGSRPTTPARRGTATVNGAASGPVSEVGTTGGNISSRLTAAHMSVTIAGNNSSPLLPAIASSGSGETRVSPRTSTSPIVAELVPLPPPQRTNSGTPTLGTAHAQGTLSPRTVDTTVIAPSPTARQGFNGTSSSPKAATTPVATPALTTTTIAAVTKMSGVHGSRHGRKESQVVIASREPRGAPFWQQFYLCHLRSLKQQHEKLSALVLESGVAMFAGFLMGVGGGAPHQGILVSPYSILSPAPLEFLIPQMCMFVNMSIGLAASSAGVKAFGEERVVYWREAGAGHSPTAYFLGVATASFYRIALSALHFSMVYHLLSAPLIGFGELVLLTILVFYTVYGLSAIVSMVLKRENAPLLAVVISLFAAVFGGYVESLPEPIKKFSYAYWSSEAMYDRSVTPFRGVYEVDSVSAPYWGYTLDQFDLDLVLVFVIGTGYRIVAYLLMIGLNRDKQR